MPNKKNKRGSGNKSKQLDAALMKSIREGGLKSRNTIAMPEPRPPVPPKLDREMAPSKDSYYDSPGLQSPEERKKSKFRP